MGTSRNNGITSIAAFVLIAILVGFVSGCQSSKPQTLFAGFYSSTNKADTLNVFVVSANRENPFPWVVIDGTLFLLVAEIEIDDLARERWPLRIIEVYQPEENELKNAMEQFPWLKETLPPRSDWACRLMSPLWADYVRPFYEITPITDVVDPVNSDSEQSE